MVEHLPERIFPLRLANLGQRLTGTISLDRMPRLSGNCVPGGSPLGRGDVQVDLLFDRYEKSSPKMSGVVGVCMTLVCQRCLQPVDIDVETEVNLHLVREGGKHYPGDDEDILELSQDSLDLATLVEDELILALPITALHPRDTCEAKELALPPVEEATESPFAVLSVLRTKTD